MVSRAFCIAGLVIGLATCRDGPLPAPHELPLGTFVIDLDGVAYLGGDTVRIAERLRGTACRPFEDWLWLDSRDLRQRRFAFHFPRIPAPTGRVMAAFKGPRPPGPFDARGHLNHPLVAYSWHFISGHADLSAASIADIRGELRGRLA